MRQITILVVVVCAVVGAARAVPLPRAAPAPDSGGSPPLPGPGLAYGGIPYGSMSGNVAEYFKRKATPSGRHANLASVAPLAADYAPIEQWL